VIAWQFLFLFVLAVEWIEDPRFGQSPISRPMASQCFCADDFKQQDF
jgi:hypothetical protein